ncbi:MAG: hypothetical protein ACYC26_12730 [Phycisphaerales bacterium]
MTKKHVRILLISAIIVGLPALAAGIFAATMISVRSGSAHYVYVVDRYGKPIAGISVQPLDASMMPSHYPVRLTDTHGRVTLILGEPRNIEGFEVSRPGWGKIFVDFDGKWPAKIAF